ncbi:hypothetical protein E3N88_10886 [Mikania micrantha]|uniref:Integrase catalytic domain-containing protein n=1 Tax=Mikania micrantha TaxID=192012 RepID=A0A5N6PC06_9ASTR|nr:hypothetical protein E3N88_10886 [Mikania micrantha]
MLSKWGSSTCSIQWCSRGSQIHSHHFSSYPFNRFRFKKGVWVETWGVGSSISNSFTSRDKGVRTLSRTEWEESRKKGLCYRCGQLYGPTHRCPEGKLRVLLLGEDEDDVDIGENLMPTNVPSTLLTEDLESPEGSCQVLEVMGSCNQLSGHSTLQLEGTLLGIPICLLVDSGATHNFISKRLGDGHVVVVTTQCQDLSIQVGSCFFVINALISDTGSLDLILEMDWLQSLGPVTHDWRNSWMKFIFHDSPVVLQGSVVPNSVSISTLLTTSQQKSLSVSLHNFSSLFQTPSSLPPSRSYDYKILLSTDDPIAVRPYRYPHIQKNGIEKQVKELLSENSIEKTAFRTHEGHYEYLVMPFGLMNAPATFQALMNDIFKPFLRKFVVIFFDDILIFSPDWSTHLRDIQAVFQLLVFHSFFLNQKKCSFGQNSIEYLGHLITGQGVSMDPKKIEVLVPWPTPTTIKGLRGFLGLTGYYRKFIQSYGSIARPLTDLTKKNAFSWSTHAQEAFNHLKKNLTSAPVLALPNFTLPFMIECDASGQGIGAVLMQQNKPVAYFSKGLSDKNLAKSAYEIEMMALVLAVQHWRPYLLGTHFIVRTDQKSLKFLLQQHITTPDQQNLVAKLLGYNFEIQYMTGQSNRAADALSRRDDTGACLVLNSGPIWVQGSQLIEEAKADPLLQKLGKDCQAFPEKHPGFVVKHDVLFYHDRLVNSAKSKFLPALLHEFHTTPTRGHSGYYRTYRRMAANLYWAGMTATVKKYVRECEICQRCKSTTTAPAGLLQPLNIPEVIWEELSMDFISGLPRSKGFTVILMVADRLSKYAHFIPLKHPYTAKGVAEEIFRSQGTTLHMSYAYHPESDGQTEVINRCLEAYLRCFAVDQPKNLVHWLPWAEFWYNTTFHASTRQTPFETVYGRSPPTVFQYAAGELKPYRQQSVASRFHQKLGPHFFGPSQIREKVGQVAYKLILPPTSKIHPVFHVSLLKKAVQGTVESVLPEDLEIGETDMVKPHKVLASRQVKKGSELVEEWLIQWQGQLIEEATWEGAQYILANFLI